MTAVLARSAPAMPISGRTRSAPAPRPRVVLRPAPHREPPFDDELTEQTTARPYDRVLPFARPATGPQPAPLSLRPHGLPEPTVWTRRLLIGLIESADGRRPLHQLASLLTPSIGRGIGAEFDRDAAIGTPHWLHSAAVVSVRGCEPAHGVAELCAAVRTGGRVRAIALRLEEHRGRWRCTRLQLG